MPAPEPTIGQPLPNAGEATLRDEKIIKYALDPEHPVGKHKAKVFEQALNIKLDDWEYLREGILDAAPECPVTDVRPPATQEERYTWEVLVPIKGLGEKAERGLLVVTAWEMVDDHPELITIRVAAKSKQRRISG